MKLVKTPYILFSLIFIGVVLLLAVVSDRLASFNNQSTPMNQHQQNYRVEMLAGMHTVQPKKSNRITYKIKNDKDAVFKNFEIAHEKIMHFIVIRHDLQYFQHLHPRYRQPAGEFVIDVTFPTEGPYRLFSDFTPGEDNPQKLLVTLFGDVQVGNTGNYSAQPVIADHEQIKNQDEYQITYTVPNTIRKQEQVAYILIIQKDGQLITDLEQYLGAFGHSIIIKEKTLDFIHTHAGTGNSPSISFTTLFPEAGTYKLFTQFQHKGKIITTEYVINVQ